MAEDESVFDPGPGEPPKGEADSGLLCRGAVAPDDGTPVLGGSNSFGGGTLLDCGTRDVAGFGVVFDGILSADAVAVPGAATLSFGLSPGESVYPRVVRRGRDPVRRHAIPVSGIETDQRKQM